MSGAPPPDALARVPGAGPGGQNVHAVVRLAGGSVNDSWLVDTDDGRYVLRIQGPAWRSPGVDRRREQEAQRLAAAAGLAPAVIAQSPEGDVRVCAIEALGRIGPGAAPATAALIQRLDDTCPAVRSAAARALGQIGPAAKDAMPALEKLARDREDYVRQAAAEAGAAIAAPAHKQPK